MLSLRLAFKDGAKQKVILGRMVNGRQKIPSDWLTPEEQLAQFMR